MEDRQLTGGMGEYLVARMFQNWGYETDIINAEGIDLICYYQNNKKIS